MKDLQDYLDSLSNEQLMELALMMEKKNVTAETEYLLDVFDKVYRAEKGQDFKSAASNITEFIKLFMSLLQKFSLLVAIYVNIRNGHMIITSGRMMLTSENAKYTITEAGLKSVDKLI